MELASEFRDTVIMTYFVAVGKSIMLAGSVDAGEVFVEFLDWAKAPKAAFGAIGLSGPRPESGASLGTCAAENVDAETLKGCSEASAGSLENCASVSRTFASCGFVLKLLAITKGKQAPSLENVDSVESIYQK